MEWGCHYMQISRNGPPPASSRFLLSRPWIRRFHLWNWAVFNQPSNRWGACAVNMPKNERWDGGWRRKVSEMPLHARTPNPKGVQRLRRLHILLLEARYPLPLSERREASKNKAAVRWPEWTHASCWNSYSRSYRVVQQVVHYFLLTSLSDSGLRFGIGRLLCNGTFAVMSTKGIIQPAGPLCTL